MKIPVLKSQGAKCKCTYGVTLPGEYLQVARRWQRRCSRIQCYTWSSLGTSSPTSTCVTRQLRITRRLRVTCRLRHRSFSIPTKETIPVYSHLGTHAMSAVDSPKIKDSYYNLRVFRNFLWYTPADGTVRHLFTYHRLFMRTTENRTQEIVIRYFL